MANVKFRIVAVVAILTTLLGIYSAKLWNPYEESSSFYMYYTAACLVRSNMSIHIYDVVDRDTNPELLFADPSTVWAQTARAHGISRITLYLYPPTLADLIVPLAGFSAHTALLIWHAFGVLMIVLMSVALARMLDIRFLGATALIAAGILLYRPTLNTFHFGQVSIVLVFLLTVGLSLYAGGHKNIAALLLLLAIAIKLEPIIFLIPLIVWRDWKCIRAFATWGALLLLGLWAVNGSDALNLYFLHQLPAMSGGELGGPGDTDTNRSFANIFFTYLGGTHAVVSSRGIAWIVRVLSVLILCCAGWFSRLKPSEKSTNLRQFEIGMIFLLLTCCLAPYSWFYNWALSAPAVVMFLKRVWDGRADMFETALLVAFLVSTTTSKFNMALITPIIGIILGLVVLYRIRYTEPAGESGHPIHELESATVS